MMNKMNVVVFLLCIAVGVVFFFHEEKEAPVVEPVIKQSVYIPPAAEIEAISPVVFTNVTKDTGIHYKHFTGADVDQDGNPTRYMPETMGPGVALLDFDQDGDLDVFVTNSTRFDGHYDSDTMRARLYRNKGHMQFEDVSQLLGENLLGYWMGVTAADYDGDNYPDLLLTGWGRVALLKNRDGLEFTDLSETVIPELNKDDYPRWTSAAAFFDADNDNDLDLFIADYVSWTPEADVFATIDGQSKSYATPDLYKGGSSRLFLQDEGVFHDKTAASGMLGDEGKSLGVAFWDFDDNGFLDIVIANDTQPNFLYYNLGGGRFENRALAAGMAYDANGKTRAGMGIDVADLGNDGHICIAIGNFSREPLSVFRDEGGGFFRERSQSAGVAENTYLSLTFGLHFADFDLDGWLDIVMANGHIEPAIENVEAEVTYKQNLQLLGNTGDAHFEDWSASAGDAFSTPITGRGLAVGDLDGDGDIDVVVTENNGGLYVLRNDKQSANHYLRVHLRGQKPNTDAIGAKITLTTENGIKQQRFVRGGSSYLSQSEMVQTFGIAAGDSVAAMHVVWPGGMRKNYTINELNKTVVIEEVSEELAFD